MNNLQTILYILFQQIIFCFPLILFLLWLKIDIIYSFLISLITSIGSILFYKRLFYKFHNINYESRVKFIYDD